MTNTPAKQLLLELQWQCDAARDAIVGLNDAMNTRSIVGTLRNIESFIYHGHIAAILVKDESLRERFSTMTNRESLEQLRIFDMLASPLNQYQQWDEGSKRHNLAMNNIGPKDAFSGIDDTDIFRLYDPSTSMFYFRGFSVNVKEVAACLAGVAARARETK